MKRETKSSYLLKNTGLFALNNLGTKLITFLLVPLYTYTLTTGEYGFIDLVTTSSFLIIPILTLNINEGITRFLLDKSDDSAVIESLGWHVLIISTGITIIFSLFVVGFDPSDRLTAILIVLFFLSSAWYQVFSSVLRGQEKLLRFSIGSILNTLLIAAFNIYLLVSLKAGVNGYYLSYIAANSISLLYCIICSGNHKIIRITGHDIPLYRKIIKYSVSLIPNTLLWWVMNASDRYMIAFFKGNSANGIYSISYKIPNILNTISTIFTQAWTFSAIRESNREDYSEYANKVFKSFILFNVLVTIIVMLILKPFMFLYVSSEFYIAWKYTPLLVIGYSFMALSTFLATEYVVYKYNKGFVISAAIGGGTNIVFNLILIPLVGVLGAAIATMSSYIIVFIYRSFNTRKFLKINYEYYDLINLFLMLVACVLVYIENYYLSISLGLLNLLLVILINKSRIKSLIKMVSSIITRKGI